MVKIYNPCFECEKDGMCKICEYRETAIKLAEYEELVAQRKLLIKVYEICDVSTCVYCDHVERRIEETWINPDLLGRNGFYKTRKDAEEALRVEGSGAEFNGGLDEK